MRIASLILLPSLVVFSSLPARAIETTKINSSPVRIDPTRIFQSQAIDVLLRDVKSGAETIPIRVRDADTKKIAQLRVTRLGAKSPLWSGFFVIQFFKGDDSSRTLEFLNAAGQPYFVYSSQENNTQKIVLFSTADELTAYTAKMAKTKTVSANSKPAQKTTTAATQAQVVKQVREQVQQQEKKQVVLEIDQAKDRAAMIEKFTKLSDAEKKKLREQAALVAKQADELYNQQKYPEASKKYSEAAVINPEEESYYFKYGVSLYKADSYNKSLAVLSLSEAPEGSELERDYYVALNHLKLKDYDKAQKKLREIRDEDDPNLSPVASYFAGTIEMQQQKFPDARKSMEFTIDKSNDPGLDKSAEAALEQIDKLETLYMKQKEKFRMNFFGGLVYDENVLNVASNSAATDVKGYRLNYGASILGFWFIKEDSDFGTKIAVSDYYSLDTNFKANAALQTADPLEFSLTVPYNKQFAAIAWNLEPVYRSIYMSPTGGTRKELITSAGLSTTLGSMVRKDLYLSGKLDYSSDTSKSVVSSTDDDQSATKYGLTVTPTFIMDLKGEKTLSPEVSYSVNQAKGINNRYKRMGLAATYAFPSFYTSNGSARLEYATQGYSEATTSRTDKSMGLTLSSNKDLKKNLNLSLSLQYNNADSSVDLYKYNKFVLTSLLSYTTSVFAK